MGDPFDPYREALVVEKTIVWPEEFSNINSVDRERIERHLLADPAAAAELKYTRLYTGFARRITVTQTDIERLSLPASGKTPEKN